MLRLDNMLLEYFVPSSAYQPLYASNWHENLRLALINAKDTPDGLDWLEAFLEDNLTLRDIADAIGLMALKLDSCIYELNKEKRRGGSW